MTGATNGEHVHPAGSLARGPYALDLDPQTAGWTYTSLRLLELEPGGRLRVETGEEELVVLPLAGSCTVEADDGNFRLHGRPSVFAAVSDFAYVGRDRRLVVDTEQGGRFAITGAKARRQLPSRYGPAEDVPVELRGAGQCSRQIVNFCGPESFEADNLIAVEVLTPGGNWSSFPPHKHDTDRGDLENVLEEVYYFEVADGPDGPGLAYQRVYGHSDKHIDVLAEVRTGDIVCIPHGWHGPSMAVPGYDLYYLNVMAGPGDERAWCICDDPEHGWVRGAWEGQEIDPRLPMTAASSRTGS